MSVLYTAGVAFAVPAKRKDIVLSQPDGTVFNAVLKGDEFMKILLTAKGEAIVLGEDGYYYYAYYDSEGKKYSSGYRVGENVPGDISAKSRLIPYAKLGQRKKDMTGAVRTREPNLIRRLSEAGAPQTRNGVEAPVEKHGLVILAQFRNLAFSNTKTDFENLLNLQGYDRNGATGCAKEYFDAQFGGSFNFSFNVTDIVTLSRNYEYYGGNDSNGDDRNPEEMVVEACRLVDSSIDFSLYDDDGDGEVDNVFIFFAGKDEADGAGENYIWSHAWYIYDGAGYNLTLDGVKINRYACTSELSIDDTGSTVFAGIGTFCHEYSHTFGLPDFYDTDYDESGGRSKALWTSTSLMDGGNMNNNGNTPPYYNVVEREILGIGTAETIGAGSYTLAPINEDGRILRVDSNVEGEYYLFECRTEEGWDKYIGGSGMLVYHIDKSGNDAGFSSSYSKNLTAAERWTYNELNANPEHQCADLVEALPSAMAVNHVFFPSSGSDSFSPDTDPAFCFWNGSNAGLALTDITLSGKNIVFSALSTGSEKIPEAINTVKYVYQDAAIITWESDVMNGEDAVVRWGVTGNLSNEAEIEAYEENKYAVILDGLTPRTSYAAEIVFRSGGVEGKVVTCKFTTKSSVGKYPYIILSDVPQNGDGSYPYGAAVPLRVANATDAETVVWTMNGREVSADKSCFYHLAESGMLKAVIHYDDGTQDIIIKEIEIKNENAN